MGKHFEPQQFAFCNEFICIRDFKVYRSYPQHFDTTCVRCAKYMCWMEDFAVHCLGMVCFESRFSTFTPQNEIKKQNSIGKQQKVNI